MMQGMTPSQIYKYIEDVLWDTQKAQWAYVYITMTSIQMMYLLRSLMLISLTFFGTSFLCPNPDFGSQYSYVSTHTHTQTSSNRHSLQN
jgi:hypothetical protein